MAMTRKFLKAMGIEEEKIEQIIEAHSDTVDALKDERDTYKADAEKLADVEKELTKAKEKLAKNGEGETVPKEDYDKLKQEYDDYKADITAKETTATKKDAYSVLLKDAGVSEKRIPSILKLIDLETVALDKDGKIKDAEKHTETIKTEWADFIETTSVQGANTATPPANGGKGKMTKSEIMAIKDPVERQARIAENLAEFNRKG